MADVEANKVYYVRLLTGEELLTQITSGLNGGGFIEFYRPILLQILPPTPQSPKPTIQFLPWPAFAGGKEQKVQVNPDHVTFKMPPADELATKYREAFSGLAIPNGPPKLIIPGVTPGV